MKLLLCTQCGSVFNLTQSTKTCACKSVSGQYTDELNAVYQGESAIPLGFANSSFRHAVMNQPESDWGLEFSAFVIEKDCPTFVRKK